LQTKDPASQVNLSRHPFLPGPTVATGAHIQCSARPSNQFKHDFEASNIGKSLSAAITAIQMGQAQEKAPHSKSKSNIRQRCNADAFLSNVTEPGTTTGSEPLGTNKTIKLAGSMTAASFQVGTPLISIGLYTDTVLDRFGLDDQILPELHLLVSSVHSSRWEAVLQSPKWKLTYEQASNLSRVLYSDLHSNKAMLVKSTVLYFSTVISIH
jgi:hypothetical protein